jgi:hypothetical protein
MIRWKFLRCGISAFFRRYITKSKNQFSEMPEIMKPGAIVPVQQPGTIGSVFARGRQVVPKEQENVVVPLK